MSDQYIIYNFHADLEVQGTGSRSEVTVIIVSSTKKLSCR